MKPVCFLDLDGVLVDFVGGALAVHGKKVPVKDIRWGFPADLGFDGVNDPAFWAPMGHDFWANLAWTDDGLGILSHAERLFGPDSVALLTSPCLTPGGVEGKVDWVRANLPNYARRLFVGPAKHLVAGFGKVLVDDHDDNCDRFSEAGGTSWMVPRPWNRMREATDALGAFDLSRWGRGLAEVVSMIATVSHRVVAQGRGSVAVGGSVQGGTIITGGP